MAGLPDGFYGVKKSSAVAISKSHASLLRTFDAFGFEPRENWERVANAFRGFSGTLRARARTLMPFRS
jgi:hypothetical protein